MHSFVRKPIAQAFTQSLVMSRISRIGKLDELELEPGHRSWRMLLVANG